MQQHPVPQPITSYEFRLVGDMTLKQFGKLASGIILALIVYGINPPGFIKWPLIILFAGIGIAMAFLPFGGRPIDVWIIAFIKRIYSPTLYLWQTKNKNQNSILQNQPRLSLRSQKLNQKSSLKQLINRWSKTSDLNRSFRLFPHRRRIPPPTEDQRLNPGF